MYERAGCCLFLSVSKPIACIDNTDKNTPELFLKLCCFIIPRLTSSDSKLASTKVVGVPGDETLCSEKSARMRR